MLKYAGTIRFTFKYIVTRVGKFLPKVEKTAVKTGMAKIGFCH